MLTFRLHCVILFLDYTLLSNLLKKYSNTGIFYRKDRKVTVQPSASCYFIKTMTQQISDSELELMKIIWGNGGTALYAQIMEALSKKGRTWQKNTIITLLSRLVDKGFLKTNKIGRRNQYTAIVSESDYQTAQTQTLLDKLYEGSAKGLVSTLIEKELLSTEDYEELKQFWESGGSSHE